MLRNGNRLNSSDYGRKRKMCFFLSFACVLNMSAFAKQLSNKSNVAEETQAVVAETSCESLVLDVEDRVVEKLLENNGPVRLMSFREEFYTNLLEGNLVDYDVYKTLWENDLIFDALDLASPKENDDEDVLEKNEEVEEAVEKIELTNEDKIQAICEKYQLTRDEFQVIVAVVIAECKYFSYEDAYAVINTIFNRSISSIWIYDVEKYQGEGKGTNMYNQVIQSGQFDPYWYSQSYLDYMDATPEMYPAMQAVIDFFNVHIDEETNEIVIQPARLHDTTNFVGSGVTPKYKSYQYVTRGNKHGVHMKEEHYVSSDFTTITESEVA